MRGSVEFSVHSGDMLLMENRVWYLFSKKLTGEASLSEVQELNNLLTRYPVIHQDLQELETIWHQESTPAEKDAFETAFAALLQRIAKEQVLPDAAVELPPSAAVAQGNKSVLTIKRVWLLMGAAATIAFIVWLWPAGNDQSITPKKESVAATNHQVSTRPGSRSKIVLPDGTQVWLNADSKLTYGDDFGKGSRDVTLSGEAYFDVVSNKQLPFYIHTTKIKVKVTGTTFNVRAYPNEKKSETSLIHGRVEVTLNGIPDKTYYLKPNEKLVVGDDAVPALANGVVLAGKTKTMVLLPKEPILEKLLFDDVDKSLVETAWVNNKLAFVDESFREVADKMERWYGVKIIFLQPALELIRFTGRFEDESIKEALVAMQHTARFGFSINDNTIVISHSTK